MAATTRRRAVTVVTHTAPPPLPEALAYAEVPASEISPEVQPMLRLTGFLRGATGPSPVGSDAATSDLVTVDPGIRDCVSDPAKDGHGRGARVFSEHGDLIGTLPPSARVVASEIPNSRFVRITPCEGQATDRSFAHGFVDRSSLVLADHGQSWVYHRPTTEPVFPQGRAPMATDMTQGEIGSCYLLSALMSIARMHPRAITEMIVDHGDAVSVRFFRVRCSSDGAASSIYVPEWVTVRKTFVSSGSDGHSVSAQPLWAAVIEKAYASWLGSGRLCVGSYAGIESGTSTAVFEHVLGRTSVYSKFMWYKTDTGYPYPWSVVDSGGKASTNVLRTQLREHLPAIRNDQDLRALDAWLDWAAANGARVDASLAASEPTLAFVRRLLAEAHVTSAAACAAIECYCTHRLGILGSVGDYPPRCRDVFDSMTAALASGRPVVAATRAIADSAGMRVIDHEGQLSGSISDLVSQHQYEVVTTRRDETGRCHVRLRNPHGSRSAGHAEVDLELNDFMRYFESCSVAAEDRPEARRGQWRVPRSRPRVRDGRLSSA